MVAKVKLPLDLVMSLPPFSFSTTVPVAFESVPPTVYVYIDVPPLPPYPLLPPQETTIPARRADTTSSIRIFRTFIMNISFSKNLRCRRGIAGLFAGGPARRIVERNHFAAAVEPASRDDKYVNRNSAGLFRFERSGVFTFCY